MKAILILSLMLGLFRALGAAPTPTVKPNIIFMLVDDVAAEPGERTNPVQQLPAKLEVGQFTLPKKYNKISDGNR